MEKKYLFIGGAGFIGSHLIREMAQAQGSPDITVLEPEEADTSRLIGSNVRLVRGTLDDTPLIEHIIRRHAITTVVHLVSRMTPGSDEDAYKQELECVVLPTISLMALCARENIRLVYFSSCAVYGEGSATPTRESTPLRPVSFYGKSKRIIETNLRFAHHAEGLRYLILRPSNPYGPGQRADRGQGLVAVAMKRAAAGQPVTIWGDGSAVRDYIYIEDVVKAVAAILRAGAENEAINISSGEGLSVREVLGYVEDVAQTRLAIKYVAARNGDVRRIVLDNSRMRQYCDKPLTSIRRGMRKLRDGLGIRD